MIPRILTVCLSCSFLLYSTYGAPQRSIQLGGQGPRPVALGGPAYQDGPIYSQQLAFGPPQTQHHLIPQQSPAQSIQQQTGRIRIPQHLQASQQPQRLVIPQQQPQQAKPFTLQPFPGAGGQPVRPQPILLKSPGNPQGLTQDEEEYDDDEYEEEPASPAAQVPQASPSPRPVQIQQRGQPLRIPTPQHQQPLLLASPGQPGPGPQRFLVPQQAIQPQPTPQQIRRPVQQRVIPAAPTPVQAQPQFQARQPITQQSQQQPRPNTLGSDSRLKNRVSTPPPVQTINRFMRNNPDGSITWGYENEDGTFKEETLGADCVVRGKYGYVDPEGNKREYEYQQGNPCDPNKKDQPEEEEEEIIGGPNSQQKLGGLLTARPSQGQLQQRRPAPQQLVYQQ